MHVDGENEMRMEFVSNRKQEHDGYLYFIVCSEPNFDQNAVQLGIVESNSKMKQSASQCTSPSGQRRLNDYPVSLLLKCFFKGHLIL